MLKLTLDHKINIGNEFLGYRKMVLYMIYDQLVDKLNFLIISSFFDANYFTIF